ncbi:MAG: helix-turn-helix domain-containing protein [Bacteroidetes bacterium]|nr:helix-turn-helix domain-containing protein [Bacteroidota bacterium]
MLKKFGADLRKVREKHNITLHDIANKTRIHITLLEKMENGDFSFYSSTYIRAFLKQYSKCIGLNPDEILFNYEMARNGKYAGLPELNETTAGEKKSAEESKEKSQPEQVKDEPDKSKLDDIFEAPEMKRHTITTNLSEPTQDDESSFPEKKAFSKSKRIKIEGDKGEFNGKYYEDRGFKMPTGLLKNLGIAILILALLYGVYLLVDVVFLSGKGSKTEIIRQNFDDIVKETEKKVLGKRTDEEIQDSIRKANNTADSIKRVMNDSISLRIDGLKNGSVIVFVDTLTEKSRNWQGFAKDEKMLWKAKNYFIISSGNTESFTAYLNGKELKFEDKKIRLVRINRQGIVKKEK